MATGSSMAMLSGGQFAEAAATASSKSSQPGAPPTAALILRSRPANFGALAAVVIAPAAPECSAR